MKKVTVAEFRLDPQAVTRLATSTGEAVEVVDENGVPQWRVAVPPPDLRKPWREGNAWCAYVEEFKRYRWLVDGLDYPIHLVNEDGKKVMTIYGPQSVDDDDVL